MIKNVEELLKAKESYFPDVAIREHLIANEGKIRKHVLICGGTGCTSSGSPALYDSFIEDREINILYLQ